MYRKLSAKLIEYIGDKVKLEQKDSFMILTGEVDSWDEAYSCAKLISDKKKRYRVVNNIKCKELENVTTREPILKTDKLQGLNLDVLIIGGGVIGTSVARELSKYNLDIMLVEKEHDVAMHASSRNDGQVHPGIDMKKGLIKYDYMLKGNEAYDRISKELDVKFERCGQYVLIDNNTQKFFYPFMKLKKWQMFGVKTKFISKKKLYEIEPNINKGYKCAVFFPTCGIVSPYKLSIAYAENAIQNGVKICLDTQVLAMSVDDNKIVSVETNQGTIFPKLVINCAGVYSEQVAKMANDHTFSIHPRRGNIIITDKKASAKVGILVSPLSAISKKKHSKGGAILPTVDGNLLIGPDAHETYDKENVDTYKSEVEILMDKHKKTIDNLNMSDVITYFSGVRAPTYEEDFIIEFGYYTKNIYHVAGIQSPGLTAAPAISEKVAKEVASVYFNATLKQDFNPLRKEIVNPKLLSVQDRDKLIKTNPDYGKIVCRCEEISKGEILDAINRNLACDTLFGVKRRVRAGMGRCQGGFCSPNVLKIIAQDKSKKMSEINQNELGSEVIVVDQRG